MKDNYFPAICIILVYLFCGVFGVNAQTNTTIEEQDKINDSIICPIDSINIYRRYFDSVKVELDNKEKELNRITHQLDEKERAIDRMKKESKYFEDLKKMANTFDGGPYCRFMLERPFYSEYDSGLVASSLTIARALGLDEPKHPNNEIYKVFEVLLKNYKAYNEELVQILENYIIGKFELLRPNEIRRDDLKKSFENAIEKSEYYKVRGSGKHGGYKNILILDFYIAKIRKHLSDERSFRKENFEKIKNNLQKYSK